MRRMIALVALGAPLLTIQAQGPRAFTPADWYRVTTLSAPALSPDGRSVAFTVTTVKEADNRRHQEVWVVPGAGGPAMRYTAPGYESSNPRWSPDGRWLLFTSTRPGSRGRTWGLRMDQPGGEAVEIDSFPTGAMPEDKRFVVTSEPIPVDTARRAADQWAAMQPMARPPFGAITQPLDQKRFDGRHVTDMRYKANGAGFVPGPREARVIRAAQLWIQAMDGSPKRIIDTTRYSRRSPAVSPDGKWIAYVADPETRPDSIVQGIADSIAVLPYDAKRDEAPRNDGDIFVVGVDGGTPRRLTSQVGAEGNLAWSPDGRSITFTSAASRTASTRLYMVPVSGGTPVNIIGSWQYEPQQYWWTPTGQLMVSAAVGGRSGLFRLDPSTKQMTEILGGRRRLSGF